MKVFNAIIGLYAVTNALYCIFWPEETVLGIGWIATVLLILWGIASIAEYFFSKKKVKGLATGGGVGLALGIVALVASLISIFSYSGAAIVTIIVILCLSLGIAVKGVIELVDRRKAKGRAMTVVAGLFHLIAGLFGALSLAFLSESLPLALGIVLLIVGVAEFSSLFGNDASQEQSEIW